jgi:hypothetical protein
MHICTLRITFIVIRLNGCLPCHHATDKHVEVFEKKVLAAAMTPDLEIFGVFGKWDALPTIRKAIHPLKTQKLP